MGALSFSLHHGPVLMYSSELNFHARPFELGADDLGVHPRLPLLLLSFLWLASAIIEVQPDVTQSRCTLVRICCLLGCLPLEDTGVAISVTLTTSRAHCTAHFKSHKNKKKDRSDIKRRLSWLERGQL